MRAVTQFLQRLVFKNFKSLRVLFSFTFKAPLFSKTIVYQQYKNPHISLDEGGNSV